MSGEYIKSSKACVYILGGEESTACLFDFDGEYVLDNGFEEKSIGFLSHVRDVAAVLLSAPTKKNIGTASAVVEKNNLVPVISNAKVAKNVKPGSSGADFLKIQELSAKLLPVKPLVFNPKYEPYVLYHSIYKGHLSLYVLAGDAKDSEAISKALSSGNEEAVEKAAAEHGTVGVLLWRPAEADKPVTRVLLQGTCSLLRVQQALDKATKALPFLNAPTVKSKDALIDRPPVKAPAAAAPAKNGVAKPGVAKPAAAAKPAVARPGAAAKPAVGARPAPATKPAPARPIPTGRAPPPATSAIRPSTSKPSTQAAKPSTTAPARPRPASAATTGSHPPARKPLGGATTTRPTPPPSKSTEAPIQKKIVGKVQGAAPSKPVAAKNEKPAPAKPEAKVAPVEPVKPDEPKQERSSIPEVVILDDSAEDVICLGDFPSAERPQREKYDIVVIPPTPEPRREEDEKEQEVAREAQVTPEPEPEEKKQEVGEDKANIYPTLPTDDVEPEIPAPVDAFKPPSPEPEPLVKHDFEPEPQPEPSKDVPSAPELPEEDKPHTPAPEEPEKVKEEPVTPSHPEPSAPAIDDEIVAIPTPAPEPHPQPQPDEPVDVATPFNPFVPTGPGGRSQGDLINIDSENGIAPGFEEPLIPQGAREDGLLPDCGEEVPRLMKISMDTDKTHAAEEQPQSDVTKLVDDFGGLNMDSTLIESDMSSNITAPDVEDNLRKLSSQMIEDSRTPFTSAFASSMIMTTENGNGEKTTVCEGLIDFGEPVLNGNGNVDNTTTPRKTQDESDDLTKHHLMQSRSSVVENGTTVHYEKTDPALDSILDACAQESEKVDEAQHASPNNGFETLHMPEKTAVVKAAKFARSYYFDVATIPRDEKLRTTCDKLAIEEFVTAVRAKTYILASKDISKDQLDGILIGKKNWMTVEEHPAVVYPTHSSPILLEFKHNNEKEFADSHISFHVPVDKQRINVSSDGVTSEYELVKVPIREE